MKTASPRLSEDDWMALDITEKTARHVNGRYEIGLPRARPDVKLSENHAVALHRLCSVDLRLKRNKEYAISHTERIETQIGSKSSECILIGCSSRSKSFRKWHPTTRKIIISRDGVINENAIHNEAMTDYLENFDLIFPEYESTPVAYFFCPGL